MGHKCALIVDDSRTAREVLSRMLAAHDLRVETAESAEAALEFLASHRPDVIFMDHMMPGMDGFQAVRAIKENPATATIPVMMYTSQSGELYVGQARALGAVGVLPKQIKPVEVTEVLHSLHLLPGDEVPPAARAPEQTALPGVEAVNLPADWSDLHRWLQEMLSEQNRTLRTDMETTVRRVMGEHMDRPTAGRTTRVPFWPAGALIVTLTAVAMTFFWLHLDAQEKWSALSRQNLSLLSALDEQRAAEAEQARRTVSTPPPAAGTPVEADRMASLFAALEWSVNQAAAYPPEELPFGEARVDRLTALLEQLRSMDFRGTVRLESHVGDFCMVRTEAGWEVAPGDLPADRCERTGLPPEDARAESARQSVAFANYLAELATEGGAIDVEIEAFGNTRPRTPYPEPTAAVTAREWNRIARANHRVDVRLHPAGSAAAVVNGPR